MHTFLLDLWHDLREKRLWPVAALLLAGLVAVPFVLLEKEQSAPAPSAPPAHAEIASDKLPTITLEDVSAAGASNFGEFKQRNPFKPLNDLPAPPKDPGEGKTVDLGESPDADGPKGGSDDSPSPRSAGSGSGSKGGSAGGSGGSGGSGGGSGGSPSAPRTTYFAYRADIRFGVAGRAQAMKQVKAFTLLGPENTPAAVFMGVTDDHRYAVFMIDSSHYEADGEHQCKPTPRRCDFVYLKVGESGNETTLTTLDGETSYDLELTAIKRVVLDKSDVENVPTEKPKPADATPGKKAKTVDVELGSLFDVLVQRR